jgi:HSP20 family protein
MIRQSPLYDVLSILDSFNSAFNQSTRLPLQSTRSTSGSNGELTMGMLVDCYATNDHAVVLAAMPGIHPDDANVSVDKDTLTITGSVSGERKQQDEKGDPVAWYLSEIPRGSFERRITLPFPIDEERVEAQFSNGMLRIVLPKLEASKPRKVSLQVMESRFPEIAVESGQGSSKESGTSEKQQKSE